MVQKLHVGNLAYSVTDDSLNAAFSEIGKVNSAIIIKDKISGRSKGFGFVEMDSEDEAAKAIEKLNRSSFEGRMMFVSESRSSDARPPRSGGDRFDRNRR